MSKEDYIFISVSEREGVIDMDEMPGSTTDVRVGSIEAVSDGRENGAIIYTERRVFFVKESREKVIEMLKEGIKQAYA